MIVGRDELVDLILRRLRKPKANSILLMAERRVGKTTVLELIRERSKEGFFSVYIDLEGISSATEFVERLVDAIRPVLSNKFKAKDGLAGFMKSLGGSEIGGVYKFPDAPGGGWKNILQKVFQEVQLEEEQKLMLLLDELPYMLQKIAAFSDSGTQDALDVLDSLRSLRKSHSLTLRMVFAGSIGLHHVLQELRGSKFPSEPVNDTDSYQVEPLTVKYAEELARHLLLEEGVNAEPDLVSAIARLGDRVPFYIERIVLRLAEKSQTPTVAVAEALVQAKLSDAQDDWEMEHFRNRMPIYYPGEIETADAGAPLPKHRVAIEILDSLALSEEPKSINEVWEGLKGRMSLADDKRQVVLEMLKNLAADHYLAADASSGVLRYAFRFPLVRRWWILAQGLEG